MRISDWSADVGSSDLATAEFGNQGYDLNTDPKATGDSFYYWGWKDQDGHGSRNRWALASELRMPVPDSLNLSVAGRYDQYRYSGRPQSKFPYSGGLEWRPIDTLLVRGYNGPPLRHPALDPPSPCPGPRRRPG